MSFTADRRRHAPVARSRAPRLDDRHQGLSNVTLGRARRTAPNVYAADHADQRTSHRFRWLLSTCLAAGVGVLAIGVVIFGSLDVETDGNPSVLSRIKSTELPIPSRTSRVGDGLKWATPKTDRLQMMAASQTAKQIIHEQIQIRRDGRPFIQIRPYVRITARLGPAASPTAGVIPPFNALALYSADTAREQGQSANQAARGEAQSQIAELLGGVLPVEDQQELDLAAVVEIMARNEEAAEPARTGFATEGLNAFAQAVGARAEAVGPNTTMLAKTVAEDDDTPDEIDVRDVKSVKIARGDTMVRVLQRFGAELWQARAMVEAAKGILPESALQPGWEMRVTLVQALQKESLEPARFSMFDENREHKVSVGRNAAGDFVASATPLETKVLRTSSNDDDQPQNQTLYGAFYSAALSQGIPVDVIQQALRVHVFDTDFRRRVTQGDLAEFFFDLKDESNPDAGLGELLYTSLSSGGEAHRFWRFRTPDGLIDYYDESGNNSKKFLMRRPFRGDNVHFTSGFGIRFHPVLRYARPHQGIDWAGPVGVPILAAGNGVIEFIGRKGEYGNHIRIRHANGYQTTYSHMSRFENGMAENIRVRQGQVIGYIGSTGLVSGPHLHFEVLLNTRYVDPLTIEVPRERRLTGRMLADFQKERSRIEDLMRRAPVSMETR